MMYSIHAGEISFLPLFHSILEILTLVFLKKTTRKIEKQEMSEWEEKNSVIQTWIIHFPLFAILF